jgi:hypothetical protein
MRRLIRGASTQTIRQQTGDQRADERAEYLARATRLPVRAVESVDAEAGKVWSAIAIKEPGTAT